MEAFGGQDHSKEETERRQTWDTSSVPYPKFSSHMSEGVEKPGVSRRIRIAELPPPTQREDREWEEASPPTSSNYYFSNVVFIVYCCIHSPGLLEQSTTGGLKPTEVHYLMVLDTRSLKSRCQQGHPWLVDAPLQSLPLPWPLPCVFTWPSYKDFSHIRLKAHTTPL